MLYREWKQRYYGIGDDAKETAVTSTSFFRRISHYLVQVNGMRF